MKPSWDDAPAWAEWLAMDSDHSWWWFELQPMSCMTSRCWLRHDDGGRFKPVCGLWAWYEQAPALCVDQFVGVVGRYEQVFPLANWTATLESRP